MTVGHDRRSRQGRAGGMLKETVGAYRGDVPVGMCSRVRRGRAGGMLRDMPEACWDVPGDVPAG